MNFLKEEVFRAQDILTQIQRRFKAEYEINKKVVEEIQVYKSKLQNMEDERNLSLLEIEKHLSIIAKTNEELEQRLNNKDTWLSDADDDDVSQINSSLEDGKQPDKVQPSNPANFSNPLEMCETVPNSPNVSSLENYLRDLYHELCARVQAEEIKVNQAAKEEPALELAEIKALLNEGDKRLQTLSAKKKGNWTNDDEMNNVAVDDVASIKSSQSKAEDNKNTRNLTLPLQDGWASTRIRTPEQIMTNGSTSVAKGTLQNSCNVPFLEEPSQFQTSIPKPIGPIRSSTFPGDPADMATSTTPGFDGKQFGKGKDYFEEMFFSNSQDLFNFNADHKIGRNHVSKSATPPLYREYKATTSSTIGSLCILELNEEGKFVRLYNSDRKDTEIGNYMIKQNVGGHPVIVFRFPPRTKFPQNSIITIWAASCDNDVFHEPPNNYIWDAQVKWGVGPEYTTILCKPNGQAIAWTNAAHRYNPRLCPQSPTTPIHIRTMQQATVASPIETKPSRRNKVALEVRTPSHAWNKNSMFLKREKQIPTRMSCAKHPYGLSPENYAHPCCTRQDDRGSLSDASTPSTIPERTKPSSKHLAQRSSSAKGRLTCKTPSCNDMYSINRINSNEIDCKKLDAAFMKPSSQLRHGLKLIQSQHNLNFKPPMPRLSRSAR